MDIDYCEKTMDVPLRYEGKFVDGPEFIIKSRDCESVCIAIGETGQTLESINEGVLFMEFILPDHITWDQIEDYSKEILTSLPKLR